ncbi:hypothetical protein E2C01_081285 [Portunus trituberculatus]|uniref:Uncharacterized protein n=1 Tax=Portunus trituberculatus TaxID=210409 RepID=A0A5B7IXK2_PORTR|nr:hypothetical protein [Portunus trituberculatus]
MTPEPSAPDRGPPLINTTPSVGDLLLPPPRHFQRGMVEEKPREMTDRGAISRESSACSYDAWQWKGVEIRDGYRRRREE